MNNPRIDNLGTKVWTNKYGQLHREDGPAIEYDTTQLSWTEFVNKPNWYLNGKHYSDELTYWLAVSNWKKAHG